MIIKGSCPLPRSSGFSPMKNERILIMKEKFYRFMQGRYGVDQFSRFLLILAIVVLVLNMFIRSALFELIPFALLIYTYFRIFSRNIAARSKENQKYLQLSGTVKYNLKNGKQLLKFHIYKCPSCGQKIRIPRGKGKIEITCPKCKNKFIKKS